MSESLGLIPHSFAVFPGLFLESKDAALSCFLGLCNGILILFVSVVVG